MSRNPTIKKLIRQCPNCYRLQPISLFCAKCLKKCAFFCGDDGCWDFDVPSELLSDWVCPNCSEDDEPPHVPDVVIEEVEDEPENPNSEEEAEEEGGGVGEEEAGAEENMELSESHDVDAIINKNLLQMRINQGNSSGSSGSGSGSGSGRTGVVADSNSNGGTSSTDVSSDPHSNRGVNTLSMCSELSSDQSVLTPNSDKEMASGRASPDILGKIEEGPKMIPKSYLKTVQPENYTVQIHLDIPLRRSWRYGSEDYNEFNQRIQRDEGGDAQDEEMDEPKPGTSREEIEPQPGPSGLCSNPSLSSSLITTDTGTFTLNDSQVRLYLRVCTPTDSEMVNLEEIPAGLFEKLRRKKHKTKRRRKDEGQPSSSSGTSQSTDEGINVGYKHKDARK